MAVETGRFDAEPRKCIRCTAAWAKIQAIKASRLAPALAVVLSLSACAGDPNDPTASLGSRQVLSTGIGAGAGGLIGSRFGTGNSKLALTGLGALVGGAAGLFLSQPPSQPSTLPVPPVPPSVCRPSVGSVLINGHAEQVNGTACQQSDGTWRMQP
jgi:surface antigen